MTDKPKTFKIDNPTPQQERALKEIEARKRAEEEEAKEPEKQEAIKEQIVEPPVKPFNPWIIVGILTGIIVIQLIIPIGRGVKYSWDEDANIQFLKSHKASVDACRTATEKEELNAKNMVIQRMGVPTPTPSPSPVPKIIYPTP